MTPAPAGTPATPARLARFAHRPRALRRARAVPASTFRLPSRRAPPPASPSYPATSCSRWPWPRPHGARSRGVLPARSAARAARRCSCCLSSGCRFRVAAVRGAGTAFDRAAAGPRGPRRGGGRRRARGPALRLRLPRGQGRDGQPARPGSRARFPRSRAIERAARMAGLELTMWYYAVASWRRAPHVPEGCRAFSSHRRGRPTWPSSVSCWASSPSRRSPCT